jgi:hypothetical protein
MPEALRHILQRFPKISYEIEGEREITLKLKFRHHVISYEDIQWLLATPGLWEIEFIAWDGELHCFIYTSMEEKE